MEARVLLRKKGITLLAILWLFAVFPGEFGCSKKVEVSQPEDFKYLEGTLVHLHKKVLVVKSDDGKTINFRVGRHTVFTPKKSRRMRDFLNIGARVRTRYFIKTYSSWKIGDYFVAHEVCRIKD